MKEQMKNAIKEIYRIASQALSTEQIYSVVLATDDDCGSLYLAFGTEQALEEINQRYQDLEGDFNFRYMYTEYLRTDDDYTEIMNEISRQLFDRMMATNEATYEKHRADTLHTMAEVMYELKQENSIPATVFTYISITDSDVEQLEKSVAIRCNPHHPELDAFLKSWDIT
ncbi:hypothetical protein GCM10007425_18250 [Lysinibacillus alkalisoli]|uniref:DUF4303 domain-containing protein n=1 Tax=Lysinibacillus alkalisoli TaxID=1911548 RepID=A0A917LH48_9BACI|nr:DUF4303 domain-containing protein [Lysinibacillus alkalisoli]GGG24128.1 hypothetical protein GCM10007425_18250 [Lysinibacillus alkalisoli]